MSTEGGRKSRLESREEATRGNVRRLREANEASQRAYETVYFEKRRKQGLLSRAQREAEVLIVDAKNRLAVIERDF